VKIGSCHAFALALLMVLFAFSCGPKDINEEVRQEVETLEKKTSPPDATILTRSGPVRGNSVVTAFWDFETTSSNTEYSKWVISQLEPEFKVIKQDDSQLILSRHEGNDTHSVECQFVPAKQKLRVHVEFSSRPD
jgi:hypothetical protein